MPSNTDRTTVYTIYAGMIPTLGFERGDFTVERAGNIGKNQTRGKTLNLGTSISPQGKKRKARIRGSVAWYEYSTTVRAIHEEVLDDDARTQGDMLKSGKQPKTLRWPTDWKEMFESGNRGLADEFARQMDPNILKPTGEKHSGVRGQPSEQETNLHGITIEHPDDDLERQQGMLVNRANAVDIYVKGRDGNIYRLDVTSMSMDTEKAHHGLGSLQGRRDAGVDSASIMRDVMAGNTADAEARLLTYFQGRKDEYNMVIQGLKQRIHDASGGANAYLEQLDLDDAKQIEDIRRDLENNMNKYSQGDSGPHIMQQLRPNLRKAIQRLEKQGISSGSSKGEKAAFKSAVQFALHALGTIVQSRNTVTEYRITAAGASDPYTIGVRHRIHPSGEQVLEFMALKQADVRIRNEASLENHYLRKELEKQGVQDIDEVLRQNAIDRNYQDSAYMITQNRNKVEVGAITSAAFGDISRDAHSLFLGGAAIMSDREFNESIDNWINTVGAGHRWKRRLHQFLSTHIHKGPMIEHAGRQQNEINRYGQVAAPVSTDENTLNHFNMIAHGSNVLFDDFGLDITGARRGDLDQSDSLRLIPNFPRTKKTRRTLAQELMSGAMGNKAVGDGEWNNVQKMLSAKSKSSDQVGYYGMDAQRGLRGMGMSMYRGMVNERRTGIGSTGKKTGSAAPGVLEGKTRKYWDLGEYLSDDQREGFDDNVNPYWWAAPYISLYYPSGQVGAK